MKKFTKITLIVAAVLLGVGLIFCGVSTAMGASVWQKTGNSDMETGILARLDSIIAAAIMMTTMIMMITMIMMTTMMTMIMMTMMIWMQMIKILWILCQISVMQISRQRFHQGRQTRVMMLLPFRISIWILMLQKLQSGNRMTVQSCVLY